MDYKAKAQILKALADETRLEIVDLLLRDTLCACDILENFHISQPTLSYHMKILTDCGLVEGCRDGAWIRYSLKPETFGVMRDVCQTYCERLSHPQNKTADEPNTM